MSELGRWLIGAGLAIALLGALLLLAGRLPWLGHLPGDLRFSRGGVTCIMPLATSLLLSIILTVVLNLLVHLLKR